MGNKIRVVLDTHGHKFDLTKLKCSKNGIPILKNFDNSKPPIGVVTGFEIVNNELIANCEIDLDFEPNCYQLNSFSYPANGELEIYSFDEPGIIPNIPPILNKEFEAKKKRNFLFDKYKNEK